MIILYLVIATINNIALTNLYIEIFFNINVYLLVSNWYEILRPANKYPNFLFKRK